MQKRYFVTGTDTEIGKTTISAGLLCAALRLASLLALRRPWLRHGGRGPAVLRAALRDGLPAGLAGPQLGAASKPVHICAERWI